MLLEASFRPGSAEVRFGGDDDSPALSKLLVMDSKAGGAAKPEVLLDVERRSLVAVAVAARAVAPALAPFFAPFCFPLLVTSTSCNQYKCAIHDSRHTIS